MAPEKPASPLPKLRPLPIRVARLHSKLLISALVGIAVIVDSAGRLAIADAAAGRLEIRHRALSRHDAYDDVALQHGPLRKRASEQDEGAFAILMLSMAATLASLVAIVFEDRAARSRPAMN